MTANIRRCRWSTEMWIARTMPHGVREKDSKARMVECRWEPCRRLSTDRTEQRFFRQRDKLFDDGQVGIVAPVVARMTRLRAALFGGRRNLLGIKQIAGSIARSGPLRLASKKLVLQGADLTARLFQLLLQLLDTLDGQGM